MLDKSVSTVVIYLLTDPVTSEKRYVGQSINHLLRFKEHCRAAGNTPRDFWIRRLAECDMKPTLSIIEITTQEEANEVEIFWIDHLRSEGHPLLNVTKGGHNTEHLYTTELNLSRAQKMTLDWASGEVDRSIKDESVKAQANYLRRVSVTQTDAWKSRRAEEIAYLLWVRSHNVSDISVGLLKEWEVLTTDYDERAIKISRRIKEQWDSGFYEGRKKTGPKNDPNRYRAALKGKLLGKPHDISETTWQTALLHVEGNKSMQEVADTLGVTLKTVNNRVWEVHKKVNG